jgi:hypothetical protein
MSMTTKPPHAITRRWSCRVLVGLLLALTAWTNTWPQTPRREADRAPLKSLDARMQVAVHEGQLSMDVREAQVRDVLAAIGQQAGLRVRIDASATRTVNAQFTAMALDQGLRRLLRAASLSYSLLYARGPAATDVLQEVRVFSEARSGAPASDDRAPAQAAQRAADLRTPPLREEDAAPEPEALEADLEPEEPEPDADAPED